MHKKFNSTHVIEEKYWECGLESSPEARISLTAMATVRSATVHNTFHVPPFSTRSAVRNRINVFYDIGYVFYCFGYVLLYVYCIGYVFYCCGYVLLYVYCIRYVLLYVCVLLYCVVLLYSVALSFLSILG
jgi:hypothetical protein